MTYNFPGCTNYSDPRTLKLEDFRRPVRKVIRMSRESKLQSPPSLFSLWRGEARKPVVEEMPYIEQSALINVVMQIVIVNIGHGS